MVAENLDTFVGGGSEFELSKVTTAGYIFWQVKKDGKSYKVLFEPWEAESFWLDLKSKFE